MSFSIMTNRQKQAKEKAKQEEKRLLKEINDSFCDVGIFEVIGSTITKAVQDNRIEKHA